MLNQDHLMMMLRMALTAGGPIYNLFANWGLTPDQINVTGTFITTFAPMLLAWLWGMWANSPKQVVSQAARVPDTTVVVGPQAPAGAQAAVADEKAPNVLSLADFKKAA